MARLLLVRHGESMATVERRIGGPRTCAGLSPLGWRQAEALGARLASGCEPTIDVLVASTYRRAVETAAVVAAALGLEVAQDVDLGEHDPGPVCDGLRFDEYVERFGSGDWEGDPYAAGFPGGETVAEFHHRVATALARTAATHPDDTVLVVCHGGVIDRAVRLFLQAPATGAFEVHTTNTSITEFVQVRNGRWRMLRYNDAAHLAGLPAETPRA
jgi:probable phosphoglycerate mutase